jgi:hypothetical protein
MIYKDNDSNILSGYAQSISIPSWQPTSAKEFLERKIKNLESNLKSLGDQVIRVELELKQHKEDLRKLER